MNDIAEQKQAELRTKRLKETGLAYSFGAVFPLALTIIVLLPAVAIFGEGYEGAEWYKYLCYLLPQLSLFAVAAVYFFRSKEPIGQMYKPCKWYYFLLAVFLQFGLLFSLSYLNNGFIWILEKVGYHAQGMSLPALSGWRILPAILVIALLPAIFEETLFRGIISRNLHRADWGLVATVLISGALFSLFHSNPEQTVFQFLCGMCFTLLSLRAGSILPTIVSHFLNNAVILILSAVYDPVYGASWGMTDIMPIGVFIAVCVLSALSLIGVLVFLIFFDKRGNQKGGIKAGKIFLLSAAVGILIFAVQWIAVFVQGFIVV